MLLQLSSLDAGRMQMQRGVCAVQSSNFFLVDLLSGLCDSSHR